MNLLLILCTSISIVKSHIYLYLRNKPLKSHKLIFEFSFDLLAKQPRPDQHQLYLEMAVTAYLTARQEVSILRSIRHEHIVPLLGLSSRQPLALVLSLAPKGSLRNELDMRKKNNQRLSVFNIKQIVIQVNRKKTSCNLLAE